MDSNVIGATHFPGGFVGYSGYPMVGGDDGSIAGMDVEGYFVDGVDEVGRIRRRRVPPHHPAAQRARAMQTRGPVAPNPFQMPANPNQAGRDGHTMPAGQLLLSSGQRTLPAAFTAATAITPGFPWSCTAQIQRGYQATRLLVEATDDTTGADVFSLVTVTSVDVGQRNQIVSPGVLVGGLFRPTSFDVRLILDPAGSGNFIVVGGVSSAAIPNPFTVKVSAVGDASL